MSLNILSQKVGQLIRITSLKFVSFASKAIYNFSFLNLQEMEGLELKGWNEHEENFKNFTQFEKEFQNNQAAAYLKQEILVNQNRAEKIEIINNNSNQIKKIMSKFHPLKLAQRLLNKIINFLWHPQNIYNQIDNINFQPYFKNHVQGQFRILLNQSNKAYFCNSVEIEQYQLNVFPSKDINTMFIRYQNNFQPSSFLQMNLNQNYLKTSAILTNSLVSSIILSLQLKFGQYQLIKERTKKINSFKQKKLIKQ